MGGIKINPQGQVFSTQGGKISGLHAIGEVTGGVHGNNRLGGNSLLECAVFGRMVGKHIPVQGYRDESLSLIPSLESTKVLTPKLNLSFTELSLHDTPDDCLIALHGEIFNLTSFQDRHPGGSRSITSLCGNDGTDIFSAAHSSNILHRVERHSVGHLADKAPKPMVEVEALQPISKEMLEAHHSFEDCWMVIHGKVYDLTDFSQNHPGGAYLIQKMAGKDATKTFSVFHHQDKLMLAEPYLVGKYLEST
jgi:cytochrome b involved in lipid metabolism